MDTGTVNLDFHGEALCSISDISLLEIVTKARGKPNGYRKIMKNNKCLFLGVNDDRQDVGTSVTVRDIFYNQPVRRKHMEISPKKVLDSIKMSVLRIALVHVNVSFKVVDMESADELFHTGPLFSPLTMLSSYFGIENSAIFYKLNLSDGELKLSGYISDPRELFSPKSIQYVYINSRFIYKGPIHKLLNQLAAKFDLLNPWQPATTFESEKRNKYDICLAFILNLHCPRSYYDIIPSERTSVEFKDWGPVLTFIENEVMRFWTENISPEPSDSSCGDHHPETRNLKCSQTSFGQYHPSLMKQTVIDCSIAERPVLKITPEVKAIEYVGPQKMGQCVNMESVECLDSIEIRDSLDSQWKWRKCFLPSAGGSRSDNEKDHGITIDISSDILNLDGDPLVPNSIDRASLEDAEVLNQVDKKFIVVVAGKILAIIDQHAADERIRLEDLRFKVLSGEMKTIMYLDGEQEMVLPEIGYQLLQNFAARIQSWGWICNIHSRDTSSFSKNLDFLHRQQTVIKLLAVPCILGVNLTDADLLEFLQQLADTDGSSTIPPSVNRVLNNKACRGAIMFGDTLLPSECSLIVEELKRTSLCFQCAHGRPTTVPLVNLDLLHNRIAKIGSPQSWHGLRQHKLSLQRCAQRLSSA